MDNLWNTNDLAHYLGKSPQWVRENLSTLGIPGIKLGQHWRFFPEEIFNWVKKSL